MSANEELVRRLGEARVLLAEIPLNAPNTLGFRAADLGDLIDAALSRSASGPTNQGADAIAVLAMLAECAPIKRWKEYEDRGEERIPCFMQVETAKAIAEFFP